MMNRFKKQFLYAMPWIALAVAFWAFGVALHRTVILHPKPISDEPAWNWTSVAGFDGEGMLRNYRNFGNFFSVSTRHPLAPIVTMPAYAIGNRVTDRFGEEAGDYATLTFFAMLSALAAGLLWKLTDDAAAVTIYLSFSYVWLLAGTAESFTVSQPILIGTLLVVKRRVRGWWPYLSLAVLAGAVTITNAVKPLLAAAVTHLLPRPSRKNALLVIGTSAALGVLGFVAIAIKWLMIDHYSISQGLALCWNDIAICFPTDNSFLLRLRMFWEGFICEPLLFHGPIIGVNHFYSGYSSWIPHLLAATVVGLSVCGLVRGRNNPVVRAVCAMCTLDFTLHAVCGWGATEGQIYCGHWFFIFPILLSQLNGRIWKYALAAAIIGWNLHL